MLAVMLQTTAGGKARERKRKSSSAKAVQRMVNSIPAQSIALAATLTRWQRMEANHGAADTARETPNRCPLSRKEDTY